MNKNILEKIEKLIKIKNINEAQFELSKLGSEFHKNSDYLYLRSKIFYINKLYYMALDTLLIATEFDEKEKKQEECKFWWNQYKKNLQNSILKKINYERN